MIGWIKRRFDRSDNELDCNQVGEVLQHYLDGQIDADTARRIEDHLEACRICGMEADTYERIKAVLAARRADVPPESIDRLRAFGERLVRGEDPTVERAD